jgi:hypothetical protein
LWRLVEHAAGCFLLLLQPVVHSMAVVVVGAVLGVMVPEVSKAATVLLVGVAAATVVVVVVEPVVAAMETVVELFVLLCCFLCHTLGIGNDPSL